MKDDKKLLNKETINEIIKIDYKNKPFILTGFSIPANENQFHNAQEEKRLQWLVQKQIELLTNKTIIEEDYKTEVNVSGGFVIEDELLDKIKVINKNKINNFLSKNNSTRTFDYVSKKIYDDFLTRFNEIKDAPEKNKNIKLHSLFFNEEKELSVKIDGSKIEYFVIDSENHKNNEITIIKERKLKLGSTTEHPDFAVYYNGLPFIVIEMKAMYIGESVGTRSALNDYRRKKTYHNFLACIGTNGNETFISSNPSYPDYFKWINYKSLDGYIGNYDESDENGLYDIIKELVISEENMLFYFESCTMVSEDNDFLKNARIQQYMTAKKVYEKMQRERGGFKNYFQHHTRTGKSFTFKIISKIAYKKMNHVYKKCIFFTHDVSSVMPSVTREFNNLEFPSGQIKRIEKRKDYKEVLKSNSIFGMYIANMQIIDGDDQKPIDDSDEVLIFIDEVHTHQKSNEGTKKEKKTMADLRRIHFPNATVISATASPLVKEEKNSKGETTYRNITSELYGECIDKVTPSDAIKLNLVTKLNYEKINYRSQGINDLIHKLDDNEKKEEEVIVNKLIKGINDLMDNARNKFLEKKKISLEVLGAYNKIEISKENHQDVQKLNSFKKGSENYKEMDELLFYLQSVIDKDLKQIAKGIKPKFRQKLWLSTLKEKIEHVVINEVLHQREECKEHFTPKFFYVISPRDDGNEDTNGEKMLNVLKNMIKDYIKTNPNCDKKNLFNVDNNVYKGIRFGFDSSDSGDEEYNGDLGGKIDITALFEADELSKREKHLTKPVDVLILVRKKLMGYDNKNLTTVFLDKEIDESNIKEMLQLSTRGTTRREGKTLGYIKDLTFSNRNIETFKKAFSIYDEKDGVKEFLFDNKEITEVINEIKSEKSKLFKLFEDEKTLQSKLNSKNYLNDSEIQEIIKYVKEQYWKWRFDSSEIKNKPFIEKYIGIVSNIEKAYKKLISPKFILEKKKELGLLDDILAIFQINAALLKDIKNKTNTIYKKTYTTEDITRLLEETFSSFGGLEAFVEQVNIRYKSKSAITIAENYRPKDKKAKLTSSIAKLQKDLTNLSGSFAGRLGAELEEISAYLDTNIGDDFNEQEKEIKRLGIEAEAEKQRRQDRIDKEFDGNVGLFTIVFNFEEDFGKANYKCLKIWAKDLDKKIKSKRNHLRRNYTTAQKIKDLVENEINFSDIPKNLSDENLEKFRKIYSEIFETESSLIPKNESELIEQLNAETPIDEIKNPLLEILKVYV